MLVENGRDRAGKEYSSRFRKTVVWVKQKGHWQYGRTTCEPYQILTVLLLWEMICRRRRYFIEKIRTKKRDWLTVLTKPNLIVQRRVWYV